MQITKLSFLSTQAVGDNVFAVEEFLDIPIDQVFGTYRSREKALFNFIESDAVQKVSRDTWKIIKDITLDAANVKMRQGDYFRVRLDEEGDDSPIHFGLDATGVFILSRAVFASLQTYRILEPGVQESIRMQFTFGGHPVVDAKLTSKFSSMQLVPLDAQNGIYELKVFTAMRPSDDILNIEVTGTSLNNNVYEAPVRLTVREPALTIRAIDTTMAQKQSKGVTWQLLMEGKPAPAAIPVSAKPDALISKVLGFTLEDPVNAIYKMRATAGDKAGVSPTETVYDFGQGYTATLEVNVTISVAPGVFITPDTTILEANQTQLIRFYSKWILDNTPMTDAQYSTTDIRGPGLADVEKSLIVIDAAAGLYGYRVTTNHKGGPIAVRTNITSNGIPYPVFFDLTSKSTPVTAVALNTLPAADTTWLEFRVQQERLGGLTPLVGVVAKQFTVTGAPVVGVQGAVEAVGQGVYRLKVTTNDKGGNVAVSSVLTIEGEDYTVPFSTTAAKLNDAIVVSTGPALQGEAVSAVPLEVRFEGKLYDLGSPSVTVKGPSLVGYKPLRRIGVGKYEIQDVNVNARGGVLDITVTGLVQGFSQTMDTTVAVTPVSAVVASDITHYRPTTTAPLRFKALRDGVPQALTFGIPTVSTVAAFTPTVETLANGEYQISSVTAHAPASQEAFGISIPYRLKGYSYTLTFSSYVEAMPELTIDTQGLIPAGGVKADYPLIFKVDGNVVDLQDSNIAGSGPAFVSIDSPHLFQVSPGVWAVKGLLPGPDRGAITFTGTVLIDGITYPVNVPIRSKDTAPNMSSGSLAVLEPEVYQTVTFTLAKKSNPVGDALLSNGSVVGDAIESFDGFALKDAATGTYRFNVVTNGKGGPVDVYVDVTLDGDVYPMHFTTTAKPGKAWGLTTSSTLAPAVAGQAITFSITNDGVAIANPYLRALTVTGSSVRSAGQTIIPLGTDKVTSYITRDITTGSPAGDVKMTVQASTNNVTWHDLSHDWTLPEASAPVVTPGPMIPAVATSIATFRVTRNGVALFNPTFSNVTVNGDAVDSATLDWMKLNANGTYGTTIKTNDQGGPITIEVDVLDDGVPYHLTGTVQADIVRPWTATLKSGAPTPETVGYIDFQSSYGGAPTAMTEVKVRLVGSCVVTPTDEVVPIYQNGADAIYRVPGVLVNNDGGPITLEISGKVYDQDVTTVLQLNVTALPAMSITSTSSDLPFRQTVDWTFSVARGANPTIFGSGAVSNLSVTGAAVAGYTPTVIPTTPGNYKISVQTNSLGGQIDLAFDVTIAGQTTHLTLQTTALVEPPVTATSSTVLETDSTGINLDFQLFRGTVPCAEAFVVQSITMISKSITYYPQTILNVDVSQGKYRIQVNTSAYSDPVNVSIVGTVRGEPVTLNFGALVRPGTLPSVSLNSSFVYNILSTGVLTFRKGTDAMTGVTVTKVEGPLDYSSVDGTTVYGIPTQKTQSTLKITYTWKGATYTGNVTFFAINSIRVTPIGSDRLKAYVANRVNFPLVQEDGSAYPAATTFTVSSAPWKATVLNKKADGTYELDLTYAGDLAPTDLVVTADDAGTITKHYIKYSVWFDLEARFSGSALLDSTQVSNTVQFDVYETNLGSVKDVYNGVDLNSLDVDTVIPDDLIGFSTFQIFSATKYRGSFFVSTQPVDLTDPEFQFFWTSAVRTYTVKGKFRVQKPILATWNAPALEGGKQVTIPFYLKSGSMPITDGVDAGTTVTGATIKRAPYVIDAAAGLYGIDVLPNGNATTLAVTLKVKQQITNLSSTLEAKSFPVTPGAFAVVPLLTLKRQIGTQNLDVQFTQGGIPLTGVVINSVSFDGAIQSMVSPTTVSGTTYRWTTLASIDGATPNITFNVTISGVGMILDVVYPIDPPVEAEVYFYDDPGAFVKGQQIRINWALKIGSNVYIRDRNYGGATGETANLITLYQSLYLDTATADYRVMANVVPKTAGKGVVMYMPIIYKGVTYNAKFVADVADACMVEYIGTYSFFSNIEETVTFRIIPQAGVTLNPAAIPTFTTPPFPITQGPVSNGDGTYTMKVTPTNESLGVAPIGTIVSNGVTYKLGGFTRLPARFKLKLNESGTPVETAGSNVRSRVLTVANAIAGTALGYRIDGYSVVDNIRVTSDAGVINGTPTNSGVDSYSWYSTVATNKVDFAVLTWKYDFTSHATGFKYTDLEAKSIAHDTAVMETVTQAPLLNGIPGDVKFKLKWQTSGNPVTNALYGMTHGITGGTAPNALKVVDAANGIYAVTVTPNAGVTSISLTPRWMYPYGGVAYSGTAIIVPVVAPVVVTQTMYGYHDSFGTMDGNYDQYLTLKIDPSLGDLTGATITSLSMGGYISPKVPAPYAVTDVADRIFRIPCRSRGSAGGTITNSTLDLTLSINGVSTTVNMLYPATGNSATIDAYTPITTKGGEMILTPSTGSTKLTGAVVSWTLVDRNGVTVTGGTAESTYYVDGKVRVALPELTARKSCQLNVQLSSGFYVRGGYFDIEGIESTTTGETT